MADNINDKEKENINNDEKINFTWKEIDEPFRKKSRGSLFNFIKRKTAEFAKVFESKKPDESVQVAKPNKPAESVEVPPAQVTLFELSQWCKAKKRVN